MAYGWWPCGIACSMPISPDFRRVRPIEQDMTHATLSEAAAQPSSGSDSGLASMAFMFACALAAALRATARWKSAWVGMP